MISEMCWSQLANVAIIIDIARYLTQPRDARGAFRTQWNIYDGAFLRKELTVSMLFKQ